MNLKTCWRYIGFLVVLLLMLTLLPEASGSAASATAGGRSALQALSSPGGRAGPVAAEAVAMPHAASQGTVNFSAQGEQAQSSAAPWALQTATSTWDFFTRAGPFEFTPIAETGPVGSQDPMFFSFASYHGASIDDVGRVAFLATAKPGGYYGDGFSGIFIGHGDETGLLDYTKVVDDQGNLTSFELGDFTDAGVAFKAWTVVNDRGTSGIFAGSGNTIQTLFLDPDVVADFGSPVPYPPMNGSGQTALIVELEDGRTHAIVKQPGNQTLYVQQWDYVGGAFQHFHGQYNLAINDGGEVLFVADQWISPGEWRTGLFRGAGGGAATVFLEPPRDENGVRSHILRDIDPDLNNHGEAVFVVANYDGQGEFTKDSLSKGDGGSLAVLAETTRHDVQPKAGHFARFFDPAINDRGDVAFVADVWQDDTSSTSSRGLFLISADDPTSEPRLVLGVGDTLFDLTVGFIEFHRYGLNNQGQLAFRVGLRDPETGAVVRRVIVRTDPTPLPMVLVPGIAGTYAADASADIGWLLNRGQPPANTVVDPLGRVYHDLIQTLRNVGYRDGIDLFVVNYDWRLPPGPSDGQFDGHIGGLEAQALADEQFRYAVDYLGWALRQAAESWRSRTGRPLEKVHVIAHSTGGLVTRTYIQSDAYGGIYDQANGYRLPEIDQFILVGVPNRGASKAWNPLHDNWIADPVYRVVLSKIVNRGYQKVLSGRTIAGPDHAIDRSSISPTGQPDPQLFISQYVPTIRSLLATYDFIDFGQGFTTVNQDPQWRNELILDLNDGLDLTPTADPSPFADRVRATVICGASERTANLVVERTGTAAPNVLLPFTDFLANDAETTDVWFEDLWLVEGGDGTVPLESCQEPFVGDERVNLLLFRKGENTSGAADHTGLMSNPDVQAAILDALGVTYDRETDIASGTGAQIGNALAVISDPVELFLVDGAGRRLGYSQATGAVTEIPGSLWRGDTEGIGYVFGTLEEPLRLELTGLGEDHYVMVSLERDGHPAGGAISSGFLAQGEEKTISVERLQGFNLFLPVVAR